MAAGLYDLSLEAGADFDEPPMVWDSPLGVHVSLIGYTARMQIRVAQQSEVLYSLTTENGGITLGGATGTINLYISAADTMTLSESLLTGIYDLELVAPSGRVTRLLSGDVMMAPNVTR